MYFCNLEAVRVRVINDLLKCNEGLPIAVSQLNVYVPSALTLCP